MQAKRAVPIVVVTLLAWGWFAWPVVALPLGMHAALGAEPSNSPQTVVSIDEVIRSKKDLWGEAAERQEDGRQAYLPPNSASNGFFLWMLRYLLVQDWDLDDDGEPETLRLMYATPRPWLADGNRITVTRAPTAFGELSFSVRSHLSRGEILVELMTPPRLPKRMLFRVRVPSGWKVASASSAERDLPVDHRGTVDLSNMRGKLTIRFEAKLQARSS